MDPTPKNTKRAFTFLRPIIDRLDPDNLTQRSIRQEVALELGLERDGLDGDKGWKDALKGEVQKILDENDEEREEDAIDEKPASEHRSPAPPSRQSPEPEPSSPSAKKPRESDTKPSSKKKNRHPSPDGDDIEEVGETEEVEHGEDQEEEPEEKPQKKGTRPTAVAESKKVTKPNKKRSSTAANLPSHKSAEFINSDSEDETPRQAPPVVGSEESENEVEVEVEEKSNKKAKKEAGGGAKGKGKDKATTKPSSASSSSKPSAMTDDHTELLTNLKKCIVACGVRKQWKKEFKDFPDDFALQQKHCAKILLDLGMKGAPTIGKAKKIKEKREAEQELEEIQRGAVEHGLEVQEKRASRSAAASKHADPDGSDGEDVPASKPMPKKNPLLAFLEDQSDSD